MINQETRLYPYSEDYILEINNLLIDYKMKKITLRANNNINLKIRRNSFTAFVGESGSGKTTLAVSFIDALVEPGEVTGGEIVFHSKDGTSVNLSDESADFKRKFRWEKISMVFQGAQSSLNPVMTIYSQFKETYLAHRPQTKDDIIRAKTIEVLNIVNLDALHIMRMYPHELSGGMKQRVMIAFALLLDPELIILDEPTTALDVITQETIFRILKRINEEMGITMVLLTHDIAVVATYADYIAVMYGGEIMEFGSVYDVFAKKHHPYTEGLIRATPSLIGTLDEMRPIEGNPISLVEPCHHCVFAARCEKRFEPCKEGKPNLTKIGKDHYVKCYLFDKEYKRKGEKA
ncbi:MAG: Oligopeptide transport ATP-binding protein OppD [Tenericutes bacterium ADurb.Bin239]|nr:ABC transporter ATP-binding protein [Bacillota bacterium]OQA79058.1 MAG: Oligopeptide transport ATP-binding protein OppD [Tenericutes bacterium ADurb.Bin239]